MQRQQKLGLDSCPRRQLDIAPVGTSAWSEHRSDDETWERCPSAVGTRIWDFAFLGKKVLGIDGELGVNCCIVRTCRISCAEHCVVPVDRTVAQATHGVRLAKVRLLILPVRALCGSESSWPHQESCHNLPRCSQDPERNEVVRLPWRWLERQEACQICTSGRLPTQPQSMSWSTPKSQWSAALQVSC